MHFVNGEPVIILIIPNYYEITIFMVVILHPQQKSYLDACKFFLSLRDPRLELEDSVESLRAI